VDQTQGKPCSGKNPCSPFYRTRRCSLREQRHAGTKSKDKSWRGCIASHSGCCWVTEKSQTPVSIDATSETVISLFCYREYVPLPRQPSPGRQELRRGFHSLALAEAVVRSILQSHRPALVLSCLRKQHVSALEVGPWPDPAHQSDIWRTSRVDAWRIRW
jgi:hypothetical protein